MTPDPLREQLARLGELIQGEPASDAIAGYREGIIVRSFAPRAVACLTELLDLCDRPLPDASTDDLDARYLLGITVTIRSVRERIARHFPAPEGEQP